MASDRIHIWKFESAGNDFILADNRDGTVPTDARMIAEICNRRTGVGADGLILLEIHPLHDFRMRYFNRDGKEATFCGNGGRAICGFAQMLGLTGNTFSFEAVDGIHSARIRQTEKMVWEVSLSMKDVVMDDEKLIDTGSPHHVVMVKNLGAIDVQGEGSRLRHDKTLSPAGCNVNFVEPGADSVFIRTFERGVEEETLSCGTGVTATALFLQRNSPDGDHMVVLTSRGGALKVSFRKKGQHYSDILLTGHTRCVFEGDYY